MQTQVIVKSCVCLKSLSAHYVLWSPFCSGVCMCKSIHSVLYTKIPPWNVLLAVHSFQMRKLLVRDSTAISNNGEMMIKGSPSVAYIRSSG